MGFWDLEFRRKSWVRDGDLGFSNLMRGKDRCLVNIFLKNVEDDN